MTNQYAPIVAEIQKSFGAVGVLLLVIGGEAGSCCYAQMFPSQVRAMVALARDWADKTEAALDVPGARPSVN